jgi:hypothetical protein
MGTPVQSLVLQTSIELLHCSVQRPPAGASLAAVEVSRFRIAQIMSRQQMTMPLFQENLRSDEEERKEEKY